MSLKEALQTLALNFADEVLAAVRSASLEELLWEGDTSSASARAPRAASARAASPKGKAAKAPKSGRLPRRSPEQLMAAVDDVVSLLKKHKDGLRSEEIRKALDMDVREVPRVIQHGIANKSFKVLHGEKRATTYGIGKGGASKPAPAKKSKPAKAAKAVSKKTAKAKPRKAKSAKAKSAKAASKKPAKAKATAEASAAA